jgi:hypothetical protein
MRFTTLFKAWKYLDLNAAGKPELNTISLAKRWLNYMCIMLALVIT